jgi:hypothetical protein
LLILSKCGEERKLQSSSLCSFLMPPTIYYYYIFTTLLLNTTYTVSLIAETQLHTHTKLQLKLVLHILIYMVCDSGQVLYPLRFYLLLISSHMKLLFHTVITKYLNSPTYSKLLLAIYISRFNPSWN